MTLWLTTSLSLVASPGASRRIVRLPTASQIAPQRSTAAASPAATTTNSPASAGSRVPSTGASTNATSLALAAPAKRAVSSTETVLVCIQTASGFIAASAPPSPSMTASTAGPALNIVITTSASLTASSAVSKTRMPASVSGSARARVRFQATTARPASAALRAMPLPMIPVPRNATVCGELMDERSAESAGAAACVTLAAWAWLRSCCWSGSPRARASTWLALRPTLRALGSIRDVAERFAAGDWRTRLEVSPQGRRRRRGRWRSCTTTSPTGRCGSSRTCRASGTICGRWSTRCRTRCCWPTRRRRVIRINRPAADLLGVAADAALGRPLEAVVSDPAVLALFDQTAEIDQGQTGDDGRPLLPLRRSLRLSRGGRRLAFQAVATRSAAGGVLVVLRDISTLDQTLQDEKRLRRQRRPRAAHAGERDQGGVRDARRRAGRRRAKTRRRRRWSNAVCRSSAGRCSGWRTCCSDLMDLSRVESAESKPVHEPLRVGELARDLRQTLGPVAAEKHVALALPDGDAAAIALVSDRRLLTLALKNLVENAVKYTPHGGRVAMTAERHDLPAEAAELHRHLTDRPYHEVIFRVSDTGVGIAPDQIGRVFERFYQVDPARSGTNAAAGRGTGLGLSIVKHAATALGGGVRVESELGKGSAFTLTLPQSAATPPEAAS